MGGTYDADSKSLSNAAIKKIVFDPESLSKGEFEFATDNRRSPIPVWCSKLRVSEEETGGAELVREVTEIPLFSYLVYAFAEVSKQKTGEMAAEHTLSGIATLVELTIAYRDVLEEVFAKTDVSRIKMRCIVDGLKSDIELVQAKVEEDGQIDLYSVFKSYVRIGARLEQMSVLLSGVDDKVLGKLSHAAGMNEKKSELANVRHKIIWEAFDELRECEDFRSSSRQVQYDQVSARAKFKAADVEILSNNPSAGLSPSTVKQVLCRGRG